VPKTPQTLSSLAVRLLRERIVSGALPPGAKLSDLVLSREIGISRTPIREAIRMLAADGLVEVVPHQGATVRAPSLVELDELYEIRAVLEAHAAGRAAGQRTPAEADELLALVAEMEAIAVADGAERLDVAATARQRELDLAFHRRVLVLSRLERLQRLVEDAGIIARPFETMDERMPTADHRAANGHHRAIAQAISDGDVARARAAMTTHIESGRAGAQARIERWKQDHAGGLPEALRPFAR
jgi:DNA-binding GntR family transcriptional regulator